MACIFVQIDGVSDDCQPLVNVTWEILDSTTMAVLSTFSGAPTADATGAALGVIGGTFLEPEIEFGLFDPSLSFLIKKTAEDSCGSIGNAELPHTHTPNTTDAIDDELTSEGYVINTTYNIDIIGNDIDPESDTLIVTEIDGNPVVVGTPIVLTISGSILTITPLIDGTFNIESDLPIDSAVIPYTMEDDGVPVASDTANISLTISPPAPNAQVNDGSNNGPDSDIDTTGTTGLYQQAHVDTNGDGTNDSSSPIELILVNPATVLAAQVQNGSIITVDVVDDAVGTTVLDTDSKQFPTPNVGQSSVTDYSVDPLIFSLTNDTTDSVSSDYTTGSDTYFVDIIVTVGGVPTTYSVSYTEGGTPDLTNLPANLQAVFTAGVDQIEVSDLSTLVSEGIESVEVILDIDHLYSVGGPMSSITPDNDVFNMPVAVATDDTGTTQIDTPLVSTVATNDTPCDIGVTTYALVVGSEVNGTVTAFDTSTGAYTFTPDASFSGDAQFEYTISCGNLVIDSAVVSITVQGEPVANDDSVTGVDIQTVASLNILANDELADGSTPVPTDVTVDLDPFTAGNQNTLTVIGEGVWAYDGAGNVTFTPEPTFIGDPTPIQYTITENSTGLTDVATITVDYIEVLADAVDDTLPASPQDFPVTGNVSSNDVVCNTGATTYAVVVGSEVGGTVTSFDVNTGAFTFTPTVGFVGNGSFEYTIFCAGVAIDTATVTIPLFAENADAVDDTFTTPLDTPYVGNISTNDVVCDAGPTTYAVVVGSEVGGTVTSFDVNTGVFTFTPTVGNTGSMTASINILCNGNIIDTSLLTVNISDPVGVDDVFTDGISDTPYVGNIATNDTPCDEGLATTYAVVVGSEVGGTVTALDVNTGAFTFTPTLGFTGDASFEVNILCGGEISATTITTISFAAPPVPTATNDIITDVIEGNPAILDILSNDLLGDGLTTATTSTVVVDLDPATVGDQNTKVIAGEGTWDFGVTNAGLLTFVPLPTFTGSPTPCPYQITEISTGLSSTANAEATYIPCPSLSVMTVNCDNERRISFDARFSESTSGATGQVATTTHDWEFTLQAPTPVTVNISGAGSGVLTASEIADLLAIGLDVSGTTRYDWFTNIIKNELLDPSIAYPISITHSYTGEEGCQSSTANSTTFLLEDYHAITADNETVFPVSLLTGPGTFPLALPNIGGIDELTSPNTGNVLDGLHGTVNYVMAQVTAATVNNNYSIIEYQTPLDLAPVIPATPVVAYPLTGAASLSFGFSTAWNSLPSVVAGMFDIGFGSYNNLIGVNGVDRNSGFYVSWTKSSNFVQTTDIYAILRNDDTGETFTIRFLYDYPNTRR